MSQFREFINSQAEVYAAQIAFISTWQIVVPDVAMESDSWKISFDRVLRLQRELCTTDYVYRIACSARILLKGYFSFCKIKIRAPSPGIRFFSRLEEAYRG